MSNNKKATIKDVAKKAGVSIATVSRVINAVDYNISPVLRQQVQTAMEELAYVPNEIARALKGDSGKDIGVVLPNITNQFYLQALVGICKIATKENNNIILCITNGEEKEEMRFLQELNKKRVKGVILSSICQDHTYIENMIKLGMNFVLLDQYFENLVCPSILFDCRAGARIAVEYLIANGHQKIALASMPLTRWSRLEIYRGYKDAMHSEAKCRQNIKVFVPDEQDLIDNESAELGVAKGIAQNFLKNCSDYTAIFCNNDMVAVGVMQELMRAGIKIPEDISVVGFDNIPLAEYVYPQLTTVSYPSDESGRLAMTMLLNNIEHNQSFESLNMQLIPKVVVRETVKKI